MKTRLFATTSVPPVTGARAVPARSGPQPRHPYTTLLARVSNSWRSGPGRCAFRGLVVLLFAGVNMLLVGCKNVEPWQRGTLADYTMRGDRDPLGQSMVDHILFSREMASGGRGVGGGGCGCN